MGATPSIECTNCGYRGNYDLKGENDSVIRKAKCPQCGKKTLQCAGLNIRGSGINRHLHIHCEMRRLRGLECNLCNPK